MSEKEKIWSERLLKKFPELKSRENPFTVRDDYFDRLPEKIRERIAADKRPGENSFVRSLIIRPATAVIAALIIITLVLGYFLKDKNAASVRENNNLTVDEILTIYPDFFDNTDEDVFIEAYLATSGKNVNFDNIFETDSSLSTRGILEYLENEDIETESFYNL